MPREQEKSVKILNYKCQICGEKKKKTFTQSNRHFDEFQWDYRQAIGESNINSKFSFSLHDKKLKNNSTPKVLHKGSINFSLKMEGGDICEECLRKVLKKFLSKPWKRDEDECNKICIETKKDFFERTVKD